MGSWPPRGRLPIFCLLFSAPWRERSCLEGICMSVVQNMDVRCMGSVHFTQRGNVKSGKQQFLEWKNRILDEFAKSENIMESQEKLISCDIDWKNAQFTSEKHLVFEHIYKSWKICEFALQFYKNRDTMSASSQVEDTSLRPKDENRR